MLALPALMAFAAAGCATVVDALPAFASCQRRRAVVIGAIVPVFFTWMFEIPEKKLFGFREVAKAIHHSGEAVADSAMLVSSWGDGEGLLHQ